MHLLTRATHAPTAQTHGHERNPTRAATLDSAPLHSQVMVARVDGTAGHRLRLAELGVRTGVALRVIGRTAGGGRVLAIGTTRLAVDRATARLVGVAELP